MTRSLRTPSAIAERAGLHRVEVSLIERGLRVPRLETILKLAGAIEADPCELIREMRWENATDARPRPLRFGLRGVEKRFGRDRIPRCAGGVNSPHWMSRSWLCGAARLRQWNEDRDRDR